MADEASTEGHDTLAAGRFSSWLLDIAAGRGGQDVPCGGCTACCTSSQFVHIAPDEHEALARIPKEVTFPAPGLAKGNVVMGYDEQGHCPMFVEGECSIYEHRPRTCRTYDCRVLAASGLDLDAGAGDKAAIAERVRRWRFDLPGPADRRRLAAVRAAAAFLRDNARRLPAGLVPRQPTQLAFLAVEIHGVFLEGGAGSGAHGPPSPEVVVAAVARVTEGRREEGTPAPGRGRATGRRRRSPGPAA